MTFKIALNDSLDRINTEIASVKDPKKSEPRISDPAMYAKPSGEILNPTSIGEAIRKTKNALSNP